VTSPPGGSPIATADGASWHRLHPLSPLVRAGRHLVSIGIFVLIFFFANRHGSGSDLVVNLILITLVLVAGVVSWLVTRWQVADGVLCIETGLIRRQSRRFPLSQVQAIDVVQTGLARALGLAELRLRMAGADSSGGRLASLPIADAERLRQRLLSMARPSGAAAGLPAAPGALAVPPGMASASGWLDDGAKPERLLFRVRSSRLAGAIALSGTGALAAAVVAAMACVVAFTSQPGLVATLLPFAIGIMLAVWRRFNGDFGTVVVAADDGLRLRSGLVQTTAETIRPGRVQAVRLVEPLVWRERSLGAGPGAAQARAGVGTP
jgi:putative membrane protein